MQYKLIKYKSFIDCQKAKTDYIKNNMDKQFIGYGYNSTDKHYFVVSDMN
jgi:hypothetical protein